jgi:hypothetical protein
MPTLTLTSALKEWAVAVDALTAGKTIVLLRKGGIREAGGAFAIAHPQVWLYPTYEHQKPQLLKPDYAHQVQPVASGWHPETVAIPAWADITHQFEVTEAEAAALLPFHIWNSAFVAERLKWKPRSPLSVLLLRVYALPQPQSIPYRTEYGGCKSWIELQADFSPDQAQPVLTDAEYRQQVEAIVSLSGS